MKGFTTRNISSLIEDNQILVQITQTGEIFVTVNEKVLQ